MPYILLALGAGIALYAFYKFFINANPHQIKIFAISLITVILSIAMFFMAITGRLTTAIGLFVALLPFIRGFFVIRDKDKGKSSAEQDSTSTSMSRDQACQILGLDAARSPSREDIIKAHKDLMKKCHPDHNGSTGLAQQLNQAKDALLRSLEI